MADGNRLTEDSAGDLVRRLADQTSTLVRQELELAQAELKEKSKRGGIGGGLFGAAALLGLSALGAFVAAAILALSLALPAWASALIVGGALALVAGVLALVGKGQVDQATPPVPERAREGVKQDVETVREGARR